MCGIAGVASFVKTNDHRQEMVRRMMDKMHHRGPDENGLVDFGSVTLGHNRLSIIDLSGGQQPIYNEDKTLVIVYNGELYNSPELREELLRKGHTFRTQTDTEVIVHLYEEEGLDCLERLNGMFAFALFNTVTEELLLARDRFGVKPLLYSYKDDQLVFASELQAIKSIPGFDHEKDQEALSIFLSLYFIPDPWTGYKHVRRLEAGHYMKFSKKTGLEIKAYHDLDFSKKNNHISRPEAEEEIARLFHQSVKRQMLSDVPVAVALSGGMDSRTILSSASSVVKGTKSFTITFKEGLFNEGIVAEHWAKVYDSPYNEMLYSEEKFCGTIIDRQKRIGEPYGFLGDVALESLAHFVHDHDIKVILAGVGGDELFAGYPTLHAANMSRYYRLIPKFIRRGLITPLTMSLPAGKSRLPLSFKLKSFVLADDSDPYRNFFQFKEVLRRMDMPNVLTENGWSQMKPYDPFRCYEQYADNVKGLELIDALSYFDFRVFMGGNLFNIGDHEFMAASVEQRVPFLDNDLVNFTQSLPVNLRFHPFKLKHILRESFKKHFPLPEGADDHSGYKKLGFDIPINEWVKDGCFGNLVNKAFAKERLQRIDFFDHKAVKQMMDEQNSGKQNHERTLQNILSTVLFLDDCYDEIMN